MKKNKQKISNPFAAALSNALFKNKKIAPKKGNKSYKRQGRLKQSAFRVGE